MIEWMQRKGMLWRKVGPAGSSRGTSACCDLGPRPSLERTAARSSWAAVLRAAARALAADQPSPGRNVNPTKTSSA